MTNVTTNVDRNLVPDNVLWAGIGPGAVERLENPSPGPFWWVADVRDSTLLFSLPLLQGERPLAGSTLTYVPQTPALAYAPASRTRHLGSHPMHTLSRLQLGKLSPKGGGGAQKWTLLRQLISYLAVIAPSPTEAGHLAPYDLLHQLWRKHGKRSSLPEDPTEPLGTSDGEPAPSLGGLLSTRLPSTCSACLRWADTRPL